MQILQMRRTQISWIRLRIYEYKREQEKSNRGLSGSVDFLYGTP